MKNKISFKDWLLINYTEQEEKGFYRNDKTGTYNTDTFLEKKYNKL